MNLLSDLLAFTARQIGLLKTNLSGITNRVGTAESNITSVTTRVDNMVATNSNSAVTLYNNPTGFMDGTITLAQPITNFDFLDIFYLNGGSGTYRGGHSTRIPAVAGTYELRTWDADPPTTDSEAIIEYGEQNVTISGSTLTAASNKQISFSIASQSSVVVNTGSYRYYITKIVGIKMGSASPAELMDVRVGADDVTYPSAGEAVRTQITDLKSTLNELSIENYDHSNWEDILSTATVTENKYAEKSGTTINIASNGDYRMFEFDMTGIRRVKIKALNFFNIKLFFLDGNNVIKAYYPSTQATTATMVETIADVPTGATKAVASIRKDMGSNAYAYKYANTYTMNETFKDAVDTVSQVDTMSIEGYKRAEYTDILVNGVLNNNAYVELISGNSSYQITSNSIYKYYKVPVKSGKSIKITGLYGFGIRPAIFVDSNDALVSYYPTSTVTPVRVENITTTVPDGASYVLITGYQNTNIKCEETGHLSYIAENKQTLPVTLTKSGDEISVESAFGSNTMAIKAYLHGSQNHAFCFDRYYLNGASWKNANDDITPLYFNSSYRGAGHGDDRGYTLTFSSAHGLTESNIGEIWTDANGVDLLICKIIDTTSILCCIPNDNAVSNASPFLTATLASPISKSGTSKAFSSFERGQFAPIANMVKVKVYADGEEITEDGTYKADHIDVVESYNLLYLPSMVTYLKAHAGSNTNSSMYSDAITEKYCTINNVFRFTENGAITQFQSIDWAKTVSLSFAGMVQSISIGDYYSVPKTNKKQLSTMDSTTQRFEPTMWDDPDYPPNRYYQYNSPALTQGICLGYNTEYGYGKPSVRKVITDAGFIYGSTHKLYPWLISVDSDYDTLISCVSYRVPLLKYSDAIPSVGWYYVNDDIYVLINAQASADTYVVLPDKMIGRKITVIETDGNITLPYDIVGAQGIKVSVASYGSAIIKLTNS